MAALLSGKPFALVLVGLIFCGLLMPAGAQTDEAYPGVPKSRMDDGAFVLGNADAPITIIEFVDFACPHCQSYKPTIQEFIQRYVVTGKAKYEFRFLPTAGGQTTELLGNIAACLDDQRPGVFWTLYDELYQKAEAGEYDERSLQTIAHNLDLNYDKAVECTQTHTQVATDKALALQSGVGGTPSLRMRNASGVIASVIYKGTTYDNGGIELKILASVVALANKAA